MTNYEYFPAVKGKGSWGFSSADVAPAEAVRPFDPVDCSVGAGTGGGEVLAKRGDAEHASTIGDEPLSISTGPGVEDLDLRVSRRGIEGADLATLLGCVGVASGRHDDTHRVLGMPAQIDRF